MPVTATLPPIDAVDAEYLELRVEHFRALTNDDVVDQGAANAMMPDTKSLDGMVARLQRLQNTIDLRSNFYDKGMRILAMARKNRVDEEEERTRTDEDEREKKNRKKRKAADSLAPQDTKPGAFLAPPIHLRRYFVGPSLKLDKHSLLSKQFPLANVIFFSPFYRTIFPTARINKGEEAPSRRVGQFFTLTSCASIPNSHGGR